jgi:hypothetical protein
MHGHITSAIAHGCMCRAGRTHGMRCV